MRKIAIVIASRANWGRLKSVCKAVDEHSNLKLQLILAASAIGSIEVPWQPSATIQCLVEGDNTQAMTLTTGLFMTQLGNALERLKPDAVLVHGDRYEVLSAAMCASYMNIPLFHTEGGEVTGTIDDKVRNAITRLADFHFTVTELSKRRLISDGEHPNRVFSVGSTALDTITNIDYSENTRKEPYVVVLQHPNTTIKEDITPLIEAMEELNRHVVWLNPNVDAGSKAMLKLIHRKDFEFIKNLPPEEYARLLYHCKCAVGNSSSFIKEGAYLGVPAVLVGYRQEGRECGNNVKSVPYMKDRIIWEVTKQIAHGRYQSDHRFGNGNAGKIVADIMATVQLGEEKKLCMSLA